MTVTVDQPQIRRRQWGAERRSEPLAIMPTRPSSGAIVWSRLAIVITVLAWLFYMINTIVRMVVEGPQQSLAFNLQTWDTGSRSRSSRSRRRCTSSRATVR